jgi:hypothetical protein
MNHRVTLVLLSSGIATAMSCTSGDLTGQGMQALTFAAGSDAATRSDAATGSDAGSGSGSGTCTRQPGSGTIAPASGTLSTIPNWDATTYTNALRDCAGLLEGQVPALSDAGGIVQTNADLQDRAIAASMTVRASTRYNVLEASGAVTVSGSIRENLAVQYARESHAGSVVRRIDDACGTYYLACAFVWSGLDMSNASDTTRQFGANVTGTANLGFGASNASIEATASATRTNIVSSTANYVVRAQGLQWYESDYVDPTDNTQSGLARDAAYNLVVTPVATAMRSIRTTIAGVQVNLDATAPGTLGWCWSSRHSRCTDYAYNLVDSDYWSSYRYAFCTYAKNLYWEAFTYDRLVSLGIPSKQALIDRCQQRQLAGFEASSTASLSRCSRTLNASPIVIHSLTTSTIWLTSHADFIPDTATYPIPDVLSPQQTDLGFWQEATPQGPAPGGSADNYWWADAGGCYECAYTQASTSPNNYCNRQGNFQ